MAGNAVTIVILLTYENSDSYLTMRYSSQKPVESRENIKTVYNIVGKVFSLSEASQVDGWHFLYPFILLKE